MDDEAKRPPQFLPLIVGVMGCPEDGEIIERAALMYLAGDPKAGRWMSQQVAQSGRARKEGKKESAAPVLACPMRALLALAVWRQVTLHPALSAFFFIGVPLLGAWHGVMWLLSFIK